MSVPRPNRRAWAARGVRVATAASTLAALAACADNAAVTAPAAAIRTSTGVAAASVTPSADLVRRVRLQVTGKPTPGYVLASVQLGDTQYALAFDTTGTVVWARAFPGASGGTDAYLQPNGNITVFLGSTHGWEGVPGKYVELRPVDGAVVREYSAPAGYFNDGHELLVGTGGRPSYLFGYQRFTADLRFRGKGANDSTAAHTIFSIDASGHATPVFAARDHFPLTAWTNPETSIQDYDHPNSIDVAPDGDLIVSWRNFDEVSKINPKTGNFVWRLGGQHSDFRFVNDPFNGFSGQHFARLLPSGNLLLYDDGNAHSPKESRAAEYRLDLAAHTATLVFEYRHQPTPIYTPFVGSVQRLGNGNTVVGFENSGVITEVTPAGSTVWEGALSIDGNPNQLTYRLIKVSSLGHLRP